MTNDQKSQINFFARQDLARRNTKWLEVYFVLAVIGTILLTYFAIAMIMAAGHHRYYSDNGPMAVSLWNPRLFLYVTLGTLTVILGGSLFKIAQLASGGSAVAEMLGGQLVNSNTSDPDERKLLNVVEEMAIASGTPVPQVYVLHEEQGINAFAAGHSTRDMVVCATGGAMRFLTRDELQGVMGHEFSHILNGDMKLNLRLMGMVFGLLCLAVFGRLLLSSGSNDRRNGLPAFGIALLVVGSIGVFFTKLIKSAVSRQREFLADASSVQFTRNPMGLASALKKVGGGGSRIEDPNAEDASHLFFANGLSESLLGMFSTHPPLEERIRLLDPAWDGKFISVDTWSVQQVEGAAKIGGEQSTAPPMPGRSILPPPLGGFLGGAIVASLPGNSASGSSRSVLSHGLSSRHLDYAADWRSKLPPALADAARDPMSAVALIYALLLSRDDALRTTQIQQLQTRTDPGICEETTKLFASVMDLESRARLPLATLTMTALRQLSPAQYEQFSKNIQFIIESDQQLELFEYALQKIVLRQLEPGFKPPKPPVIQFYVLKPLVPDCAILLSALAYAGQQEPAEIETAFRLGAMKLNLPDLPLSDPSAYSLPNIDAALNRLNQGTSQLKKLVLEACAETVAADGVIEESEAELLRAIADTLDCPIPPMLSL